MRKNNQGNRMMALLLAAMLFMCSFPVAIGEDAIEEGAPSEVTQETFFEPEEVTAPAEAPAEPAEEPAAEKPEEPAVIEVEPSVEPEPVPAEKPAAEPEAEAEPAPQAEPEAEPEPAPQQEPAPEQTPEEEQIVSEPEPEMDQETEFIETAPEPDPDEEISDLTDEEEDELFEFDDEDVGTVSDDLLEQFNNPETFVGVEFSGTADIVIVSNELYYGRDVTLKAKVSEVEMSYRVVWEANDGDERGWFTISTGTEYTFKLNEDIVDREYRVVLFSVD